MLTTKEKLNLSYFDKLKYFNGNGFPSGSNGDMMVFRKACIFRVKTNNVILKYLYIFQRMILKTLRILLENKSKVMFSVHIL